MSDRFSAAQYLASPWLKASDLGDGPTIVTIKSIYMHVFEQSGDEKPVMEFHDLDGKKFALNKTQARKLAELFGLDETTWPGQRISLYAVPTQFNGTPTLTIAIGAAPRKKSGGDAAAQGPLLPTEDIPF